MRFLFPLLMGIIVATTLYFYGFIPKFELNFLKKETLKYANCKESKIKKDVTNFAFLFNGVFYDKPLIVCLKVNNTAYCLESKIEKVEVDESTAKEIKDKVRLFKENGKYYIGIVYFDKTCDIQESFNIKGKKIIVVDYEYYLKNIKPYLNTTKIKEKILKFLK